MTHNFLVILPTRCSTTVPIKLKLELENITTNLRYGHLYKGVLIFPLSYLFYHQSIVQSLRIFKNSAVIIQFSDLDYH